MSGKLFFQIVLLIVIAIVLMGAAKCAMRHCKLKAKGISACSHQPEHPGK